MNAEQKYFECQICHNKSYNINDIKERYCNKCHKFEGEQIMPDGRPLYAWESGIKIRKSIELSLKKMERELLKLQKIFSFSVEHWQDFQDNTLHFFVRADSALLKDFKNNPEKYFQLMEKEK